MIEVAVLLLLYPLFVFLHEGAHALAARVFGYRPRIELSIRRWGRVPVLRGRMVPDRRISGRGTWVVHVAPLVLLPAAVAVISRVHGWGAFLGLPVVMSGLPSKSDVLLFMRNDEGYVPLWSVPLIEKWEAVRMGISILVIFMVSF